MQIRKRGDSYQADYIDSTGKRIRRSFTQRKEALEFLQVETGKQVVIAAKKIRQARLTRLVQAAHGSLASLPRSTKTRGGGTGQKPSKPRGNSSGSVAL